MGIFPKVSPFLFEVLNNPSLYEIVIIRDVSDDYSLEKNARSNIMSS
jgi:hypothetical protein